MQDQQTAQTGKGQKRFYRSRDMGFGLKSFSAISKETDLWVHADKRLEKKTLDLILKYRSQIELFIDQYPEFAKTLDPFPYTGPCPDIVKQMTNAGKNAGVGPMAAVAGAMAEKVGLGLLSHSKQVIVENGGDLFLKTDHPVVVGIYSGKSVMNMKVGLKIDSTALPTAVCTSSGTIGHSLSYGIADAVCVISKSCALADAAATAIGNRVKTHNDVAGAIESGKRINGIQGIVVIAGENMGAWGKVELIPLKGKKG